MMQVEHPVTEMITNINIPASMLMVGMGIPLQRMPDVRRLYGLDPTGDDLFDLDQEQMPAVCHTIAVRVTAENPDEVSVLLERCQDWAWRRVRVHGSWFHGSLVHGPWFIARAAFHHSIWR